MRPMLARRETNVPAACERARQEAVENAGSNARRMPIDQLTRLPLLVVPVEGLPTTNNDTTQNFHHHFYAKRSPHLEGIKPISQNQYFHPEKLSVHTLAGLAVRVSRGQMLPVGAHDRAHARFGLGPELPESWDEKFATAILAVSGIASRTAVDVSRPEGRELVRLDEHEHNLLMGQRRFGIERRYAGRPPGSQPYFIGYFFLKYAVRKVPVAGAQSLVDEYLHTRDRRRRIQTAGELLSLGLAAAVEPIRPTYLAAKQAGMAVHGDRRDVLSVASGYVESNHIPLLMDHLTARLKKEYRQAA